MRHVVIAGGGEIGSGWAGLIAAHGIEVTLIDPDVLAEARASSALERTRSLGIGTAGTIARIHYVREWPTGTQEADLVIEAVPEDLDLKHWMLALLSRELPRAILTSSTSSIAREVLAAKLETPERLILVHPLQPVYAVPVVEVNASDRAPQADVDRLFAMFRSLGMEPVRVRGGRAGLVANRLTAALLREALDLIARGDVTASDLDRIVARGIALGWVVRGPLATEVSGGGHLTADGLLPALERTMSPLWKELAHWQELDDATRARLRTLTESLGPMTTAHTSSTDVWAETLVRVARAAASDA